MSPVFTEDGSKLCLRFLETLALRWDLIEEFAKAPGSREDKCYQAATTGAKFKNNRTST